MSRSGYSEEWGDQWATIRWRGAVASAIRGRRGQAFLREMLATLDAMPDKRLIAHDLEAGAEVCALGSVGRTRGLKMDQVDPEDYETVAAIFAVPQALAQEIMWENDEAGPYVGGETPEQRWSRIRRWVLAQIIDQPND